MSGTTPGNLRATLYNNRQGALAKYSQLVIGTGGIWKLLSFELRTMLLENLVGALGLLLRRRFYRPLFKKMGRNVILGKGITLRHPGKISLGDDVAIDDYCSLDARGGGGSSISIGDNSILSRGTILRTKDGSIVLARGCNIGSNCTFSSIGSLEVGENLLMGSNSHIIAGGQHVIERADMAIIDQGLASGRGVSIGNDVWLGARVTILDGVRVGDHAVVGACSLVNRDIPDYAVAYGIPARVVRDRREKK